MCTVQSSSSFLFINCIGVLIHGIQLLYSELFTRYMYIVYGLRGQYYHLRAREGIP